MKFEIDVSGSDIFKKSYTICVANKNDTKPDNHIIKGFRFGAELQQILTKNWESGKYRYDISDKQRGFFKVRLYSIVIYHIFKAIPKQEKVSLTICIDFQGHQNDINQNLKFFLESKLNTLIGKPRHQKLPKYSNAHWYAKMMHNDKANQLNNYVDITLEDFEEFLKKKKISPKGIATENS